MKHDFSLRCCFSFLRPCALPRLLWAGLLLALLAGCAGVKVGSLAPQDYLSLRRADILTTGQLSPATQDALRVIGTEPAHCQAAAQHCRQEMAQSPGLTDEQRLAALAEIWLQIALGAEYGPVSGPVRDENVVIGAWLETARHAYAYLFFTPRRPGQRAFEDRQTQVRDYYNFAVQQASALLFRSYQRSRQQAGGQALPDHGLPAVPGWSLRADASNEVLPQGAALPSELLAASSLTFTGLRNIYRRDGFGAELVAVEAEHSRSRKETHAFREMPYPALTVLLRFGGQTLDEVLATRTVEVMLVDPYRRAQAELAGMQVPVAANFTSGYGLWLARSDFASQSLRSLFGVADGLARPTVYLMQPYDPSRRVIVMLHGLASSPEAWINVANEVLGDEELRRHYQVWQVYYPTNAPIALNLQGIRQALQETFQHFDPQGQAAASQHVTLIGHSMGGVLSRLLVSRSDVSRADHFLAGLTADPVRQSELRQQLQPYLEFQALAGVDRAIFIAAPHRGTSFANLRVVRWLANLITLPAAMLGQLGDLARTLAQVEPSGGEPVLKRIPNSIDNLSDSDPFIRMTAELPIDDAVRYHSIIGNDSPERELRESSDGIVPYASAHLPHAQSELVLPSGHSVQENPRAILEVRRILKLQLAE
jgi:pimeloyl-ACP methyl ester carboxylesterase